MREGTVSAARPDEAVAIRFVDASRRQLVEDYLPKLRRAVSALPEHDLWWRPNDVSNSVGNLLLHLEGNLRQWVVAGVGGEPDTRRRQAEFDAVDGPEAGLLLARLEEAVREAERIISALTADRLLDRARIQGRDVTVLEAVYHAIEHFGMHTGQIILLAKLRSGRDLGFYGLENGIPRRSW